MVDFETSKSKSEVSKSNSWKITSFLENYGTSEGAVSHNVLYYQPLPDTRHQVKFYANNYFESLPILPLPLNTFAQDNAKKTILVRGLQEESVQR